MRQIFRAAAAALALALAGPALAVVTGTSSRVEYTGNGVTTVFSFTFKATDTSHVKVYVDGAAQAAGYTVARNANQDNSPGGSVTFLAAPANGAAVRIERTLPLTQTQTYTAYAAFPAKATENALDRLAQVDQQLDRRVADEEAARAGGDSALAATHAADKAAQQARDAGQDATWTANIAALNGTSHAATDLSSVLALGSTTPRTLTARFADAVNVLDWNAWADGSEANASANTQRLQAALDAGAGKDVVFPPGIYVVDGAYDGALGGTDVGGLLIPSNTRVILMPGATVKQTTSSSPNYHIFRVGAGAANVTITGGGTIQGDRATHVYAGGGSHEWGHGIVLLGGVSRVTVENVTVKDCTGDGIYLAALDASLAYRPTTVAIRNVVSTNNRHQGMSILDVDGLKVEGSTFSNTNGTAPQAGVDVEPEAGHLARDLEFSNCTFSGNAGEGFKLYGRVPGDTSIEDVTVTGGRALANGVHGVGILFVNRPASVSGLVAEGNHSSGIWVGSSSQVSVVSNRAIGNSQGGDRLSTGITITDSDNCEAMANVVRQGSGATRQQFGVLVSSSTGVLVAGNKLTGSGVDDDLRLYNSPTTIQALNATSSKPATNGLLMAAATDPSLRPLGPTGNLPAGAHTYVYGLTPGTDGSASLGSGDNSTEAMVEIRGGQLKQGDPGSSSSGVRLMRGTAAGGFQTLAEFKDTAMFSTPIRLGTSSGPTITAGAGSPEGVAAAPVGSLYTRTDGGAGTVLYVKESGGAGNTGWIAK